jgi:hypothetical protein
VSKVEVIRRPNHLAMILRDSIQYPCPFWKQYFKLRWVIWKTVMSGMVGKFFWAAERDEAI